jgi:hypothetical protein
VRNLLRFASSSDLRAPQVPWNRLSLSSPAKRKPRASRQQHTVPENRANEAVVEFITDDTAEAGNVLVPLARLLLSLTKQNRDGEEAGNKANDDESPLESTDREGLSERKNRGEFPRQCQRKSPTKGRASLRPRPPPKEEHHYDHVHQRPNGTTKGRASLRPRPLAVKHHVATGQVANILPATAASGGCREEEVRAMRATAVFGGMQGEVGAEDGGVLA